MNALRITNVAVLGLGTMGHGIAQSFAAHGCAVRCFDEHPPARDTLINRVRENLRIMAEAGIGSSETIQSILDRIQVCSTEADTVQPAQFVVEAVYEDLSVKQELFRRIEPLVSVETILASNSSSFPITQTAEGLQRPERAILTHWFNPPHIIPVVEVVPGRRTSEDTTRTTVDLHRVIGKTAVRINQEIPGFLVNRIQVAMFREVFDLLERGVASAEEIDLAVRESMGLRLAALGPLQIVDFAGLDVTSRVYENLVLDLRSDAQLHVHIRQLLDQGRTGVKAAKGIFDYASDSIPAKQAQRDQRYLALLRLLHQLG